MYRRPIFFIIILAFSFIWPGKSLQGQQSAETALPMAAVQAGSNTSRSDMQGFMKTMLDRTITARNPSGGPTSSKVVLSGGLTLDIQITGSTCGASNGSFNITASGGTAPYQYSILYYPFQNDGYFFFKGPVSYNILVKDAAGLTATAVVVVPNTYPQPDITHIDHVSLPTGCTTNDGSVTVSATGGTGPYQFSIDDTHFQSSGVFNDLAPGDYSFWVRDANGCENVQAYTMGKTCSISFGYGYSQAICHPGTGYIQFFTTQGGTAPYSYSKDGLTWQSSTVLDNLSIGRHIVYIKDAAGVVETYSFAIYQYCPITLSVIVTTPSCGQNDGVVTASGGNGTEPYQYSIDGGVHFQLGNSFTGIAPGSYSMAIKDKNDLQAFQQVIVVNGCPSAAVSTVNDICAGGKGSAEAAGSGGTQPYEYAIDGTHFQASNIFNNLTAGSYTLTIRDKKNATGTTPFTIVSTCPVVSAVVTAATCGNANGGITATGSDGTAPYAYSIDGANYQSSGNFTDLAPANYTVYVKDAVGGVNKTPAIIANNPGPMIQTASANATCADNDGSLSIIVTGGRLPVQYSIDGSNFQSGPLFTSLKSGDYIVQVKDADGCGASHPAAVAYTNTVTLDAGIDLDVCQGKAVQLKAQSNAANISWSPALGLDDPHALHAMASPAATTEYHITAATGVCQQTDKLTVRVQPAPIALAGGKTAICYGKSTPLTGSGGVVYNWTPARDLDNPHIANPTVITPETSTLYHLIVTDDNGCQSLNDAAVQITVTPDARVSAGKDTSIAIGEPLQLHAVDINDSKFYSYSWSPGFGLDNALSQDPTATLHESMTYLLTAVAPGGCTAKTQIHISVYKGPDIYIPNAFSPNGDGHNDILKAIPIGIKEFRYVRVFSRWGEQVFSTVNAGEGWDGRFKGQPLPTGTFVWIAEGIDYLGKVVQRKGTVMLIR